MTEFRKHVAFNGKLLIVGFGAVGQGTLPLIVRHIDMPRGNIKIITATDWGREVAQEYGVAFVVEPLVPENYQRILDRELKAGDFLFNASFDVSSLALIEYCAQRGIMYLDACIEPWAGGHTDTSVPVARRTNYAYREAALAMRERFPSAPTCVLMHGANPGLVSHFLKQALLDINRDTGTNLPQPTSKEQWAHLAMTLGIKTVQIAERDRQVASPRKQWGEFANTWSSGAFVGETLQPAELGWGTRTSLAQGRWSSASAAVRRSHRRPGCACVHGCREGPYHGWLISHGEAHSSDYLSARERARRYQPTCYCAIIRVMMPSCLCTRWSV